MGREMEVLQTNLVKLVRDTFTVVKDVQEVENLRKDHWLEMLQEFVSRVCTCNRIRNRIKVYQN